ncbi:MAG: HipA N-terminal domain-containing protein, partial [Muribaculaceae bacterium]|nr:HipA N-terminal domain-containing protein [Muribaculaceae bacterium]
MVDIARVNLYGHTVGFLRWDSNREIALFEYSDGFIGKGIDPSPILMPVRQGRVYSFPDLGSETFKRLPGMIADSLPDTYGRALFDRWLALTGRQSSNVVETLCFLGKRCMGALEFEPAMDIPYGNDMKIELESLVEVASEALAEKEEFGANLDTDKKAAIAEIVRLGTSAGGQRAKSIIAYNEKTGE